MATLEIQEGQWLWLPDDEEVYIAVKPVASYSDSYTVEDREGNSYNVKVSDNLRACQKTSTEGMNDMINLSELFDGAILNTLRDRYKKGKIYTFISSIIIAINPYEYLPLYSEEHKVAYHEKKMDDPHPYSLADNAYDAMVKDKKTQAVIISGESGSGKTETTKIILRYLSYLSGTQSDIEKQIVDANPIVEAFGNAKTLRNHNSSRFGKWIEIDFDKENKIMGGRVKHFLLEVARVFSQDEGERNFHIFYQMCAGLQSSSDRALYNIGSVEDYNYLGRSKDWTIDGMDDEKEFKITMASMRTLKFDEKDITDILKITASILHLGQIEFDPIENGEKSKISESSMEELKWVSTLLDLPNELIQTCLLQRDQQFSRNEMITIYFKPEKADESRDAFGKLLYSKVFDYIIAACNKTMEEGMGARVKGKMIGILDIFGFECFQTNRFEQLMINYTNERLQQHFNSHVFILEQKAYREEDVDVKAVNFSDNQGCINMIEKSPNGLLPLLDEELRLPKGSDLNYTQRIKRAHKKNPYFETSKIRMKNQFQIKHYAGSVPYITVGFLEKNRNEVPKDLMELITKSFVCSRAIMKPAKTDRSHVKRGRKKKQQGRTSIGTLFKKALVELMSTLNASSPHFIRCIKPNSLKAPLKFDAPLINEQLRYSGVQAVVEIRQKGYPFRILHKKFFNRYKFLSFLEEEEKQMKGINATQHRSVCQSFCKRIEGIEGSWVVGRSKVLLRTTGQEILEGMRRKKIDWSVAKLQGRYKMAKAMIRVSILQKNRKELIDAISLRDFDRLNAAIKNCEKVGLCSVRLQEAKDLYQRLMIEKQLKTRLKELCESKTWDAEKVQKLLDDCAKEKFSHALVNQLQLRKVHEKMRDRLRKAMKSKNEDELTAAIDDGIEIGLDPEDPKNCPVMVKAFRFRLRLRTQEQVEIELKEATVSKNREKIKRALKKAQDIDLPPEIGTHAACLRLAREMDECFAALDKAVTDRDYDGLLLALRQQNELGQQGSETVQSAQALLETLKKLNDALNKALAQSDFEMAMSALDAAEQGQLKCAALGQARTFVTNNVELDLKSALKKSVLPNADWSKLLNDALQKAGRLEMENHPLAEKAIRLRDTMKAIQGLRNAMETKEMHVIKEVLQKLAEKGVVANEWPEIQAAQDFVDKVQKLTNKLDEASHSKSPDELGIQITKAEEANVPPNLISPYKTLHEQLLKVVTLLTEACNSGARTKLDKALSQAQTIQLHWEHPAYMKAREELENLSSFEEKMQAAIKSRRLEELKGVLTDESKSNHHLFQDAKSLMEVIEQYNTKLDTALKLDENEKFYPVVKAIDSMEEAGYFSLSLDRAKHWTDTHVRSCLNIAQKEAMIDGHPAENWNQRLTEAINKANKLDLDDIPAAQDANNLKKHLAVLEGLKNAVEKKQEGDLEEYINQATAMNIADDTPLLVSALKYRSDLEACRSELVDVIKSRKPALIEPAILALQTLTGVHDPQAMRSYPILYEASGVLKQLNRIVGRLKAAIESSEVLTLETVLGEAKELGLAEDTYEYVDARKELSDIVKFNKELSEAMRTRIFEDIDACIKKAAARGLDKKALPNVLEAQKLYTVLGQANTELQEANVSGDLDMLENALETARKTAFKGRSFNLAKKRIETETIRSLKHEISAVNVQVQLGNSNVDVHALAQVFQRFRDLKIDDEKLALQAGELLNQSKGQQHVIQSLNAAVKKQDETALDKALKMAREANISSMVPAMSDAEDYKAQLNKAREYLQKGISSRELGVLTRAIEEAKECGLGKKVWGDAQNLEAELKEVANALQSALDSGNVSDLNVAIFTAEEARMAEHTALLTKARRYKVQVSQLEEQAEIASRERRFSMIDRCIKQAELLRQTEHLQILDLKGLHQRFKKIDDQLRKAITSGDQESLDDGLMDAMDQDMVSATRRQGMYRVNEEVGLELARVLRKLDRKKKTKDIHDLLDKNLQRVEDLQLEAYMEEQSRKNPRYSDRHAHTIEKARKYKKKLDYEDKVEKQLARALKAKNVKDIKANLEKIRKFEPVDKETLAKAEEFIDRLPPESDDKKAKAHPLEFRELKGHLEKRAKTWPYKWSDKYWILEKCHMRYYEASHTITIAKGQLFIEKINRSDERNGLAFSVTGKNREFFLATKNEPEMKKWVDGISLNLRIQAKLKRIENLFYSLAPDKNEAISLYQLCVLCALIYCPPPAKQKQIISEIERNFSNGRITLKACEELVMRINPAPEKPMGNTWRRLLVVNFRELNGFGMVTKNSDAALLLAYAFWIPRKSVLNQVRNHFAKLGETVTCATLLSELQLPKNAPLARELGLDCDVPYVPRFKEVQDERKRKQSVEIKSNTSHWQPNIMKNAPHISMPTALTGMVSNVSHSITQNSPSSDNKNNDNGMTNS